MCGWEAHGRWHQSHVFDGFGVGSEAAVILAGGFGGDVVVEATGLEKYFGQAHVLRGVDLSVRRHETVVVIGQSGSGKTTLLRCLNYLSPPTLGSVRIGDVEVEADPFRVLSPKELEAGPPAPVQMAPRGYYAYQIVWNDGHDTGIYSIDLLRQISKPAGTGGKES